MNAIYDSLSTLANPPVIVGPEPLGIGYNNFQNYMAQLDESKLGGYAYHLYHAGSGNDNSLNNYMSPENFRSPMEAIAKKWGYGNKPIIMTEFCTMEENGKEEYMTGLAHIMQVGFTSGSLNGYIAWELFWGEGKGQLIGVCTKGWGSCTEDQVVVSPEYHALRHYSKFVNPGWYVVSSELEGASDLYAVAFKSEGRDSVTVVVINESSAAASLDAPDIMFNVPTSGSGSGVTLLTAVQSVENGDKSKVIAEAETYSLPGNSITTFVYKFEGGSAISLAAKIPGVDISIDGKNLTVAGTPVTLQLFDMQGRPVFEAKDVAGRVPLSGLASGHYVLRVKSGSSWQVQRIQLR